MTWICIPSIYSQVREGGSWQIDCLDTPQSALSKSKTIPEEFFSRDNLTEFYQYFPFGTMLNRSDPTTQNVLVSLPEQRRCSGNSSFVAGSLDLARTSAQPARESGSKGQGLASGLNSLGSLARWDQSSSSWKTPQCSLVEGLDEFSETWPDWGLMLRGESYQRPMLVPPTSENESGYWHTPSAQEPGVRVERLVTKTGEPATLGQRAYDKHPWRLAQVGLTQQIQMRKPWPTPRAADHKGAKTASPCTARRVANGQANLPESVVESLAFPTPTARDWKSPGAAEQAAERAAERAQPLSEVIGNPHAHPKTWPIPASCNGTGGATGLAGGSGNRKKPYEMLGEVEGKKMGCQTLNPNWVEWLMNWPVGWTSLEVLNEHEFKYWQAASAANDSGSFVREMWFNREAGAPPQGQEPIEQFPGEPGGSLLGLPSPGTSEAGAGELQGMWEAVQTEAVQEGDPLRRFRMQQDSREQIGRVAMGMTNRVNRLKAIGNGQVPQTAAMAFRLLHRRLTERREIA